MVDQNAYINYLTTDDDSLSVFSDLYCEYANFLSFKEFKKTKQSLINHARETAECNESFHEIEAFLKYCLILRKVPYVDLQLDNYDEIFKIFINYNYIPKIIISYNIRLLSEKVRNRYRNFFTSIPDKTEVVYINLSIYKPDWMNATQMFFIKNTVVYGLLENKPSFSNILPEESTSYIF